MGSSIKTPQRDDRRRDDRVVYCRTIAQQAGGGTLGTQVHVPPSNDDGCIIRMARWVEAREAFEPA